MRPAFIPVGQIVNAHGIRGEVKVNPHGFDPEFLTEFDTIYIDNQPVKVLTYPAHKIYQVCGQREYLIPAVPGVFIESTDPDAGEMRVHMMKGLATDED